MTELNTNIEKISSFFKKSKPKIFPINGHLLESEEEYAKEIYTTMLYVIATMDGEIKDGEKLFMERLAQGLTLQDSSKYIKRALNLDEELLSEFLRLFSGKELARSFFVDSLILKGSSGDITEKSLEIISEYAEVLKLSKEEVGYLSELATVILEQSNEKYHSWLEAKPKEIKSKNFIYYSKQFAKGRIAKDQDYEYWTGKFEIKENIEIEYKDIDIKDADINIYESGKLGFNSCNVVSMENSKFKGHDGIEINNSSGLEIKNSLFRNFKGRALRIESLDKMNIDNSEFLDCFNHDKKEKISLGTNLEYTLEGVGGAIYAKDVVEIYIDSSKFKNCVGAYGSAISIYRDSKRYKNGELKNNILNSTFINCNKDCTNNNHLLMHNWRLRDLLEYLEGTIFFNMLRDNVTLENNSFQNCIRETNISDFLSDDF